MKIIICCDNQTSSVAIERQLNRLCAASVVSYYNISDFLLRINDTPDAIMMIAQSGACSTEVAMLAREHNPKGKLLWFSDLDFSLFSFRLKATYFGLIPIEDDNLKIALGYCGIPLKNGKTVCRTDDTVYISENRI